MLNVFASGVSPWEGFSMKSLALILMVAVCVPAWAGLVAGVAEDDITPPVGGKMAGYSDRGAKVSTGVHDPLKAKALVLKDDDTSLAIVTMDLGGLTGEMVAGVKKGVLEKTGIDQVMLVTSHTHSGPDSTPNFPSAEKPYLKELEAKLIGAVVAANGNVAPVKYGAGKGEAAEGHNRRKVNPDGTVEMFWANPERVPTEPVDHMVGVIRFEKLDGTPLATLVNFTCHNVVLGPENLEISADYAGVMQRTIEKELGGTCMFAQGACGDINPFMDKTPPKNGAFKEAEKMGNTIAAEVVRVSKEITMRDGEGVQLTAQTEAVPIRLRYDMDDPEVVGAIEKHYGAMLVRPMLERMKKEWAEGMDADLVTVTLGDDVAIAGWPGEFFVQYGLDLKARCAIQNTFVFGYCNKTYGYFPTINAAWQGGYGAKEATVVAVGMGDEFLARSLVNLYYQTGRLTRVPEF